LAPSTDASTMVRRTLSTVLRRPLRVAKTGCCPSRIAA
jgi:hypothetical protein